MKGPGTASISRMISAVILFFFLLAAVSFSYSVSAEDGKNGGPDLDISSVYGRLDTNGPSTLYVVLHNNATGQAAKSKELDLDPVRARGITAELVSDDERVRVLSGPQMAGSLGPGENTTVEFMALAEGAEVGIYPARLRLSYSRLERVSTSSEDIAPDIIFVYEDLSEELPLPVKVVLGPKIMIQGIKGAARPGEASELEVIVANEGDEAAIDLQLEARANPPFLRAGDELGNESDEKPNYKDLEAGSAASFELMVLTEGNATPGYSPLPCSISYRISPSGQDMDQIGKGSERREDIALLVMVEEDSHLGAWMLFFAGILIILILAVAYIYYRNFKRNGSGRSGFGKKRKPSKTLLG
ncbi:MAG: hypothetical protein QG605_1845 [Euryarchaeota archaeon]|nr:hypothetical protein [Euryarchaeota archaeon]